MAKAVTKKQTYQLLRGVHIEGKAIPDRTTGVVLRSKETYEASNNKPPVYVESDRDLVALFGDKKFRLVFNDAPKPSARRRRKAEVEVDDEENEVEED